MSFRTVFVRARLPRLLALAVALAGGAVVEGCQDGAVAEEVHKSEIALQVGASKLSVNVGESVSLQVAVSTSPGRLYTLQYTSTDQSLVSASPAGVVTGNEAGSAIVNVVATIVDSGASASASIEVIVVGGGSSTTGDCTKTDFDVSSATSDGGYAWFVVKSFGTPADTLTNLQVSSLRLFEDGKELGPAHAKHADVRSLGGGRFSHWSDDDGSAESLRFSTSDNSDPRSNGRRYMTCTTASSTTPTSPTAPTSPTDPPPAGVAYAGVSAAMWAEIDSQRAAFGDPNDCHARVNAIPTSGGVTLQAGGDVNAALASNAIVFLAGGNYKLKRTIDLDSGKKLIGVAGQTVTIDASSVDEAVWVRSNSVLANVQIKNALDVGLNFYDSGTDSGSNDTLIYRVSVGGTGLVPDANENGAGIGVWQGAANNCIVSTEVFDSWNDAGTGGSTGPTASGGNADGYRNTYGAHHNTFIDAHSYRNSDDGIDMWEGGTAFFYFTESFDNGKTTGKAVTGDGNGIKLGVGSSRHYFYKSKAYTNASNGFDINGNTVQPLLVQCTATGNGNQDYFGVTQ